MPCHRMCGGPKHNMYRLPVSINKLSLDLGLGAQARPVETFKVFEGVGVYLLIIVPSSSTLRMNFIKAP
jgi:hypothetical protein